MGKRINAFGVILDDDRIVTLVKEKTHEYTTNKTDSPERLARIMIDVFKLDRQAEECFYMLAINSKGEVIGAFEVHRGDLSGTMIHPRELFKRAILCNAAAVAFAHNHPSGDATPSEDDITSTRKLVEAGKVLGVEVWDHAVIGSDGQYISMREECLI